MVTHHVFPFGICVTVTTESGKIETYAIMPADIYIAQKDAVHFVRLVTGEAHYSMTSLMSQTRARSITESGRLGYVDLEVPAGYELTIRAIAESIILHRVPL